MPPKTNESLPILEYENEHFSLENELHDRSSSQTCKSLSASSSDGKKNRVGILAYLCRLEQRMDEKFGLESEAIIRKLPENRKAVKWYEELSMALLWASGTMNLACCSTGFLGWSFGLSLKQSLLCCIFGSILGSSVTGYLATFGAATGLRQMSISRYSFGWWPNKLVALLNVIQQIGWAAVGCITGGVALSAVASHHLSPRVGVVIIAAISFCFSLLGLRVILVYERYAWIVFFVIFMILFGEAAPYVDNKTPTSLEGSALPGAVLTLLAIVYGSSASWCTIASDYYVEYPANENRIKVFLLTTLGLAVPTSIGMTAGAVAASTLNNQPAWKDAYDEGIGDALLNIFRPSGFSHFLVVMLMLSAVNVNIMNTYSAGLSIQQMAKPLSAVPRFIWTFLCFAITIGLGVGGSSDLNQYLQSFLSLLGYWCTSYFIIILEEHAFIRRGKFTNYNLDAWNDPNKLPHGIAAAVAFGLGVVAWVMGMSEDWYVGPLADLFEGSSGGDMANEFTFVVTGTSYLPLRMIELSYFGR